jgi:hypothetical protein
VLVVKGGESRAWRPQQFVLGSGEAFERKAAVVAGLDHATAAVI